MSSPNIAIALIVIFLFGLIVVLIWRARATAKSFAQNMFGSRTERTETESAV